MEIPVYLFVGFLESGKTKFIQETLEDKRFHKKERTLVLMCEEGEEEYEPSKIPCSDVFFKKCSIMVVFPFSNAKLQLFF